MRAPLSVPPPSMSMDEMRRRLFPKTVPPPELAAHMRARVGLAAVFKRGEQIAKAVFGPDAAKPPPARKGRRRRDAEP
jgi:hypothetical protein